MLSNLSEAKAREAPLIVVANHGDDEAAALADHVLWVPKVDELLSPIVNVIPLQLLAYHIADIDGKDVDQPRNLAKTVERSSSASAASVDRLARADGRDPAALRPVRSRPSYIQTPKAACSSASARRA